METIELTYFSIRYLLSLKFVLWKLTEEAKMHKSSGPLLASSIF